MMDYFFNGALSAIHSFRGYMEQIIILFRPAAFYEDLSYAFGAFFIYKSNASVFVTERRQSTIVWSVLCRFHSLYHCHLLPLIVICCYSLSFVVTRWATLLSFHKQSQCLAKIYYYLMQNFFFFGTFTCLYNLFVKVFQKNVLIFTLT